MVKIYTTPTCVYCEMIKEFFKEKGIAFKAYDVSKDEALQREIVEKSGQYGLPIVDVNGIFLSGFDRVKLEEAIAKTTGGKSKKEGGSKKTKTKAKTKAKKKK